ncbi:hypothetical protein EOD41_11015 [Mucilaginibacter limnophilus]|uniref:Uncharacterized protein n=1 Tax=Mucilaginibacter limnophilus TaxID=1932778 RepID=A0A437MSC3_9SPHI|nr:hypothetical protein [Mucilaginibacter limnophilus]RVU00526.1 hypothetical protein EOD41_11015 [Mucilaginibacter limnophilus]
MNKDVYNESVKTGQLQLVGFWPNFSHFGLVAYLLFIPAAALLSNLIGYFQNSPFIFQERDLGMIIIPLILAIIAYIIQKRRLNFRLVQTNLSHIQLKEILKQTAKEHEWILISSTNYAYVGQTNPSFFSGSWGEQITILFYNNCVLINSICDPQKRASVASWGRNRKNEKIVIEKIKQEDHQSRIITHVLNN